MSTRPPRGDVLLPLLGPLDGARIAGGCDYCNAYQTVEPIEAGVWTCRVHHDDWCPWLKRRSGDEPS
jgi:hypothetical protein